MLAAILATLDSSGGAGVLIYTENFDRLLNSEATFYKKVGGSKDKSGVEDQTLTPVFADIVPCRMSTIRDVREFKVGKQLAIAEFKIYCRPQTVPITEKMIIEVDDVRYNALSVLAVRTRDASVHHLEILVETVRV